MSALPSLPTKYESATSPGLFFWAENSPGVANCWIVVAQAGSAPVSEAHDDWFADREDADEIAKKLAAGEDV